MTEEEKQLVRLRQRLNTRKKREAARQKQKEGNQTNFSKSPQDGNQLNNQSSIPSSSSSMHSSPGLSIPHPQGFSHNQSHSLSPTRSHHSQSQNQSLSMTSQWGTNNLMSPPQVPGPYQRPGPIHPNNLILPPQSGYPPQRYDANDFSDRAQMQNQLKMSMGVLEGSNF